MSLGALQPSGCMQLDHPAFIRSLPLEAGMLRCKLLSLPGTSRWGLCFGRSKPARSPVAWPAC